MWRVDSRVGWRRREAIWGVREGVVGFSGGRARRAVVRRCVDIWVKDWRLLGVAGGIVESTFGRGERLWEFGEWALEVGSVDGDVRPWLRAWLLIFGV